ncbi:AlpA family transcriptional regulator [Vibrio parahaemolyticus]|uniref:AlpA family transcriptional regulator n=1 Tax=Vibrio parahaemolyticus TaxID=670 RepID=UPI003B0352A5
MNHLLVVPASDSFLLLSNFIALQTKLRGQKTVFFYVPVNPMGTHSIGGRPMRFIKLKEVMHKTALSRSAVYRKMNEGTFPKSISTGDRSVVWKESEIEEWMTECLESR